MPDQRDFKHITVHAPEDDDIVIIAGATDVPEEFQGNAQAPVVVERFLGDAEEAQQAHIPSGSTQAFVGSESSRAQTDPAADGGYHQTTLEDIANSRMPKTQVIIIVLALVALAAFIIWYIVS